MSDTEAPLFHRVDGQFRPTEYVTGPWRIDAMHGGPAGALLAQLLDAELDEGETVVRVTLDLESPVPIEPLRVEVVRRRTSRRVSHLVAVLLAARGRVAAAHALVVRGEPSPQHQSTTAEAPLPLPGAE